MAQLSNATIQINRQVGSFELVKLLNDESVDETTSSAIDTRGAQKISVFVESGADVSGGVVKFEGALTEDYAGTWHEIASITTSSASKLYQAGTAVDEVLFPYVRARIETVIAGGTVDAYIAVEK